MGEREGACDRIDGIQLAVEASERRDGGNGRMDPFWQGHGRFHRLSRQDRQIRSSRSERYREFYGKGVVIMLITRTRSMIANQGGDQNSIGTTFGPRGGQINTTSKPCEKAGAFSLGSPPNFLDCQN